MAHPNLFDRKELKRRRQRALAAATPGADFLMAAVAQDLGDRLATISRSFPIGLDLGGHTGHIANVLATSAKVEKVLRGDLMCPDPSLPPPDLVLDDALPPFREGSLDLVVSALQLHLVNDLPGALAQIRKALRPDGLFLAVLPGTGTLHELRDVLMRAEIEQTDGAAPRVAPFADTRDLGGLLQRAGFALPVTDVDPVIVRYDTLFGLIADLRAMGATSILADRNRRPLARPVLARAAELYAEDYADADGRIRATFSLVTLCGWAPHENQQKPLKPGSAKARLASALGTTEFSLGGRK
ncbi:MAG: methyltransferase domain-containing protein [Roseibium sp.]|nr:methyltransferase domain-containing protein [Roseibium sp.]